MSELRKRKDSDAKAPESAESDHVSTEINILFVFSLIHIACLRFLRFQISCCA
jgi:hypothetical protein